VVHRFNAIVAQDYGLPAAVLFFDIAYWVRQNRSLEKNFKEGRYWHYDTLEAFRERHPYLSRYQITSALLRLEQAELIQRAALSHASFDRTRWYTLGEQARKYLGEDAETPSGSGKFPDVGTTDGSKRQFSKTGSPIPIKARNKSHLSSENPHQGDFSERENVSHGLWENPPERDFAQRRNVSHGSWENPSQRDFSQENNDSHLSQESPLLGRGLPERGNDSHGFGEGFPHREPSPIKYIPAAAETPFGEGVPARRKTKPSSRRTSLGGEPGGRKGEETQEVFPQTTPGGTVIWARSTLGDGEPLVMIETEGGEKVWTMESQVT
jgi:hypothetical protein